MRISDWSSDVCSSDLLKGLLKGADELFLATDEDREGEAIAWHLLDELKPKNIPVKRLVFHEITKPAILEAVENPREKIGRASCWERVCQSFLFSVVAVFL